jgi:hypothetical protein
MHKEKIRVWRAYSNFKPRTSGHYY